MLPLVVRLLLGGDLDRRDTRPILRWLLSNVGLPLKLVEASAWPRCSPSARPLRSRAQASCSSCSVKALALDGIRPRTQDPGVEPDMPNRAGRGIQKSQDFEPAEPRLQRHDFEIARRPDTYCAIPLKHGGLAFHLSQVRAQPNRN